MASTDAIARTTVPADQLVSSSANPNDTAALAFPSSTSAAAAPEDHGSVPASVSQQPVHAPAQQPILLLKRPTESGAKDGPACSTSTQAEASGGAAPNGGIMHEGKGGVDSGKLSDALSALQVKEDAPSSEKEGSDPDRTETKVETAASSKDASESSAAPSGYSNGEGNNGEASTSMIPLDLALSDALSNGRDRPFVMKLEADISTFVRDSERQVWELPLMNSYQRLLVHRLADCFEVVHSIDPITKAVCLTKSPTSAIPSLLPSQRAKVGTPSSEPATASFSTAAPTRPQTFKIMRRDPSASTTRSQSPHPGASGDDAWSASPSGGAAGSGSGSGTITRKDRRNMTIEEREAAYREARERIFQGFNSEADAAAKAKTAPGVGMAHTANGHKGKEREGSPALSVSGVNAHISNDGPVASPQYASPLDDEAAWGGMTRRSVRTKAALRPSAPAFDPSARGQSGPSSNASSSSRGSNHSVPNGYGTPMIQTQNGWHHFQGQPLPPHFANQHPGQPAMPPTGFPGTYPGYPLQQQQNGPMSPPMHFDPMQAMQNIQPPQGMYQAGIVQGVPVFAMSQPYPGMPAGAHSPGPPSTGGRSSAGSSTSSVAPSGIGYDLRAPPASAPVYMGQGAPYGQPPVEWQVQPPQPPTSAQGSQLGTYGHVPYPNFVGQQSGGSNGGGRRLDPERYRDPHRSRSTPTGLTAGHAASSRGSSGSARSSSFAGGLELGSGYRKSPSHDASSVVSSSSASSRSSKPGSGTSTTSHPLPARPDWAIARPTLTSRTSFGSSTSSIAPSASVSVNGAAETASSSPGGVASTSGLGAGGSASNAYTVSPTGSRARSTGTASPSSPRSAGTASPTSASRSVSAGASVGLRSEASTPPVHDSPTLSKDEELPSVLETSA